MVRDGSISHKMFRRFKISRHMGGLSLLVSLHREGSAPDVCTAGLFVAAASVVLKAAVS